MRIRIYIAILLLFGTRAGRAQQVFSEGVIVYSLKIDPAPQKAAEQPAAEGLFTLTIKGRQYMKELELSSGFRNRILIHTDQNTAYSLRQVQDKKFAIQLNPAALEAHCSGFSIKDRDCPQGPAPVSGYNLSCATTVCNQRAAVNLYYTKDWTIPQSKLLFEDFPAFRYLPLAYDIYKEDGSVLHFTLKSINSKPVDNGLFRIPAGYRTITQQEYRQLMR